MITQDILTYIKEKRAQNFSDDKIRQILIKEGWQKNDINTALKKAFSPDESKRVLKEVKNMLKEGILKKEDILALIQVTGVSGQFKEKSGHRFAIHLSFQQILYLVGAVIVILGLSVFIGQFWSNWSLPAQVLFSFILSGSLLWAGKLTLDKYKHLAIFGHVALILSAIVLPLGIWTTLDLIGADIGSESTIIMGSAILLILYYATYQFLKHDLFLIFSIFAASLLFFSSILQLLGDDELIFAYAAVVLGISYLSLGYYYKDAKVGVVKVLYFFGLGMFLGAFFGLTFENVFWELLFPFALAGIFYLSVKVQSRIFFIFGILFVFFEILRITGEYFSNVVGWPIALMVAGFAIIFVGHIGFSVNKKFFKQINKQIN